MNQFDASALAGFASADMKPIIDRRIVAQESGPPPDKLTVVGHVYHHTLAQGVSGFPIRFSRYLSSRELTYARVLQVGEEWTPIDTGWVENAATVVFENSVAGRFNPTYNKQRDEFRNKIVEVSYSRSPDEAFLIHPQAQFFCMPSQVKKLFLRSREGIIPVLVQVVPE